MYNRVIGEFLRESSETRDRLNSATGEKIACFYLPDFQRPPVWSEQQNIRFLESVWLELPIGVYVINTRLPFVNGKTHPFDMMLLDGQQRIRALIAYKENKFPVFGHYFRELGEDEHRRFFQFVFPRYEVSHTDINQLKEIYNRMNFGGTAHTLDQIAK